MNKGLLTLAVGTLLLSGCMSNPATKFAEAQQKQAEAKKADRANVVAALPDWVLNHPVEDESNYYGVGSSVASDLQAAIDDARTYALLEIARARGVQMSSQNMINRRKGADGRISERNELVADEFMSARNVAGYRVVTRHVLAERSGYRAYVLVALPRDAMPSTDDVSQKSLAKSHGALVNRVNADKKESSDETVSVIPLR